MKRCHLIEVAAAAALAFGGCSEDSQPAGACQATTPGSCLSPTLYCGPTGTCLGCVAGTQNCDGDNVNGCECTGTCNGALCVAGTPPAGCDPMQPSACGDPSKYCSGSPGQCLSCAAGTANCDGISSTACECAGTCNGTICVPGTPPPAGLADNQCPPTTQAVTSSTTVSGATSLQLPSIPAHCSMSQSFSQAIKIQVSARTKLQFNLQATGAVAVLSLRTQCDVDHGCQIGQDTVDNYERTVDPGTYNLIVATEAPASYTCKIDFAAPDP